MLVTASKSYKINKLSNSEPQTKKVVLARMENNFAAIFDFFSSKFTRQQYLFLIPYVTKNTSYSRQHV